MDLQLDLWRIPRWEKKIFSVQGISWFEARAYAKYKGLSLPNIFQWLDAANLSGFKFKLPNLSGSNFNSISLEMLMNLTMKLAYYQI